MPERNEAIFYVERPIEVELDDGHVLVRIGSGRWRATFLMSEVTFLASHAKGGLVASEVREKNGPGKLLTMRKGGRDGH